ncbi:hypothetical protein Nepgr_025212 [Nepenthes gracilis]|uniref:Transmembrane protein n=1 Tax=Nepenthes gracilis TaxID=150966 RepID=A0AAD3Y0S0_NEPGR|nr:hypothetical protein Nepgr_025212 [Nepenthes gracilis]
MVVKLHCEAEQPYQDTEAEMIAAIAHLPRANLYGSIFQLRRPTPCALSLLEQRFLSEPRGNLPPKVKWSHGNLNISMNPRSSGSSNDIEDDSSNQTKAPFGYTRKDVLLIGLGVTATGVGLKSGLEFVGVDSLQAGNAVQLIMVLGLTIGWILTYVFRVSNKEMTYAQQLRDYENKVMQKRLESLTEAELEALLEQVEEEKGRSA